jgi:hypothetical protein
MRIDLSINASPRDGLIVTQHRSFLKPRESGTSPDPSLDPRGSVRRASGLVLTIDPYRNCPEMRRGARFCLVISASNLRRGWPSVKLK